MGDFDYTTNARSFAFRFPALTYVLIQINFWIAAFVLLVTVTHFNSLSLASSFNLGLPFHYLPIFWSAVIIGFIYGILLGILDWQLDKSTRKMSLGILILTRSLLYFLVLMMVFALLRYVIWEDVLLKYFYQEWSGRLNDRSWKNLQLMIAIYALVMAPVISFINQMNKKFGPGVLLPMLFGKYRQPVEEQRMFMFMDMKSSTAHAEVLGHIKYSALIRDCFLDINQALVKYRGEIYQYVGDEVVINWLLTPGFHATDALDFFFDCQLKFEHKKEYYVSKYGLVPEFKAGLHFGMVTTVEVGDIKREIAYHGDTINTAARIQSVCNQYGKTLLISEVVADMDLIRQKYRIEFVDSLALKGKEKPTSIYAVEVGSKV